MEFNAYNSIHVQRMHEAVFAPSLLVYPQPAVYVRDDDHARSVRHLLQQLDTEAESLNRHFLSLEPLPMGKYFEHLLFFLLERDERYRIILRNYQIQQANRTIGELDLIVSDTVTQIVEHWEIALKYYLQCLPTPSYACMIGPNGFDTLERKMKKLTESQLPLVNHPAVRNITGSEHIESKLFMKGQFFYHLNEMRVAPEHAHPDHQRGWWSFQSECDQMLDNRLKWTTLWKPDWIGKHSTTSDSRLLTAEQMAAYLDDHFRQHDHSVLCVGMQMQGPGWMEVSRGHVVNNDWPTLMTTFG